MKQLLSACALVLLVSGGVAFSQGEGQSQAGADKRVEMLEGELAALKQKSEASAADLAETKALLSKTLTYLEAQSKSAGTMAATLDEAERLGFTYGINPESRTTLLRGWREQLTAAQAALPTPSAPKAEALKTGAKKQ